MGIWQEKLGLQGSIKSLFFIKGENYAPNHKKFYKNRDSLEKTIRRAWEIGAFDHRKQIEFLLKSED